MRPSYYLPRLVQAETEAVRGKLIECDLLASIGEENIRHIVPQKVTGPDGHPGLIITVAPMDPASGVNASGRYHPDSQTWLHVAPKGYWMGWDKSAKPTEPDLRRSTVYEDYKIELADGCQWSVMAVRPFERFGQIPRVGSMGENGEWKWRHESRFDDLFARVEKAWQEPMKLHDDYADLAALVLQVNYCVDRHLLMALEVLTSNACYRIVDCAMDTPVIEAWATAKKKGEQPLSGSLTSAGDVIPQVSLATVPDTPLSIG